MFFDCKFSKFYYGQLNEVLFCFDVNIVDMYNVSYFLYGFQIIYRIIVFFDLIFVLGFVYFLLFNLICINLLKN